MAMLTLNVGGVMFNTTSSTLCKSSFFEALLRNSGELCTGDNDVTAIGCARDVSGNLFVDRNSKAFNDILEFLRTSMPIVPSVPVEILRTEAEYYGIQGFEVCEEPKKIHLPSEMVRDECIQALSTERFHHRTRVNLDMEELPAQIRQHAQVDKRGCAWMYLEDITDLGFKRVLMAGSNEDDSLRFQRRVRTTWIDLREYDVDEAMWDSLEVLKSGHAAKVQRYE